MKRKPELLLGLMALLAVCCEPEVSEPMGIAPVAAFTALPTSTGVGQSIQFTDQSTNNPSSWHWDFGDGNTSTQQNPLHTYTMAGVYTVELTATNSFGSNDKTKFNFITINVAGSAPVAAFTVSRISISVGQSVQFTDQSTNVPTSWNWNFGDGGTSTLQNPSHLYSMTGTFTVSLTASNNSGTDSETKNNYITVSEMTSGTFTDNRDGQTYNWVKIGNQIWMAENLAYLPSVNPPTVGSATESYYYVPGYNGSNLAAAIASSNYSVYGVLYNWTAAMNGASSSSSNPSGVQGVCPSGWHLPSDAEWTEMTNIRLGGEAVAGGKMKETGTLHWENPNNGATNESGFTGLPAGYRDKNSNTFNNFGTYALFWSTTQYSTTDSWGRGLYNLDTQVYNYNYFKDHGFSVRCVKDY